MAVDPYVAYTNALLRLLESTAGRAAATDDLEVLAEEAVEDFEDEVYTLAEHTWTARAVSEHKLADELAQTFRALDAMLGITYATSRMLTTGAFEDQGKLPEVVHYACSILLTRALGVGHELCAMLRAGFPAGARARWRTLYELDIVAAVLYAGNRGTAARYVNHRWILLARKPQDYVRTEELEQFRSQIERMEKALIRRYGSSYSTTYGWAAELSKRKLKVAKPQFWHLERIANLDHHRGLLPHANQGVHADALGVFQVVNDDGLLHAGATSENVASICGQTVRTLGEIAVAVIGIWSRYESGNKLRVLASLVDELSLEFERECLPSGSVGGPEVEVNAPGR